MEVNMEPEIDYKQVLEQCKKGKVTEDLKKLHSLPKGKIPWNLFPAWARPNSTEEIYGWLSDMREQVDHTGS